MPRDNPEDAPVSATKFFAKLDADRKLVQERMQKVHEKERSRYQRDHQSVFYQPGEKVWLKVLPKDKDKLDPLWMGPCEILKHVHSGRYTVLTPYGDEDHHMDAMKPYTPELTGKSIPFLYYKPTTVPEGDTWIVEKILKHRKSRDGRLQWLVKWRGYEKTSWENAEQFVGYTQNDWKEYNLKHNISVKFE